MERFSLRRELDRAPQFAAAGQAGLSAIRKTLPPQFFYDPLGSALFGAICPLPEYYLTRSEEEILIQRREEIAEALGKVDQLVELGSGSSRKTRLILDQLARGGLEYVPIDVDVALLQ